MRPFTDAGAAVAKPLMLSSTALKWPVMILGLSALWGCGVQPTTEKPMVIDQNTQEQIAELNPGHVKSAIPALTDREVFRGAKRVILKIYPDDEVKQRVGESKLSDLETKLEFLLRQSGLDIGRQSMLSKESDPALQVSVNIGGFFKSDGTCVYSVSTVLSGTAYIEREKRLYKCDLDLWRSGDFGFAGRSVIAESIVEVCTTQMTKFVNKWMAANQTR
jgi:hypothetical protein